MKTINEVLEFLHLENQTVEPFKGENKKYYYYTNNSQEGYQLQTLIYTYFETIKSNELITYIAGEGIDYEEVVSKYDNEYIELKGPDYLLTTIYSSLFISENHYPILNKFI